MLTKITEEFKRETQNVLGLPLEIHRTDLGDIGEKDSLLADELHANLETLNRLVAKVQFMSNELRGLIKRR